MEGRGNSIRLRSHIPTNHEGLLALSSPDLADEMAADPGLSLPDLYQLVHSVWNSRSQVLGFSHQLGEIILLRLLEGQEPEVGQWQWDALIRMEGEENSKNRYFK